MPKPPEGSEPKTPRRRGTATAGAARATTPKAAPGEKPKRAAAPKPAGTGTTAARKRQAVAAGPEATPKARPRHHMAPDRLQQLIAAARASLEDDKAEDIVVLDVTGRANFADCMIIATGLADRQIQAMAAHLEEAFEKVGFKLRRDRIQGSPDWVLIDADDLVIHLFKPEARANYALERMWGPDSPKGEGVAEGAPEAG
ncbi:MAG: ribosome silencing factor [Acetobacteraceae bacterium]|nr:ribosome silencing factor [Acetobacteraceae bacterium]